MNIERIRRLEELLNHYGGKLKIDIEKGTITGKKPTISAQGYYIIQLWKNNKGYIYGIHEIVSFLGDLDLTQETINHKDGNKLNNKLSNLEVATYEENNQHAFDTGLGSVGESHYNTKMTKKDIEDAIEMRKQGKTYQAIADMFNVSYTCAYQNINGSRRKREGIDRNGIKKTKLARLLDENSRGNKESCNL